MAIAFDKASTVDDASGSAGANVDRVITVPSGGFAAGELVVLGFATGKTIDVNSITDSAGGNTWTKIAGSYKSDPTNDWQCGMWYSLLTNTIATAGTITVHSGAGNFQRIYQFAGFTGATLTLDKTASAQGVSGAASSGVTATRSQASEVLVGVVSLWNGHAITQGTNFTKIAGTDTFFAMEYQLVSSAGTDAATFTFTSDNWECGISTFYEAVAGVPSPLNYRTPSTEVIYLRKNT